MQSWKWRPNLGKLAGRVMALAVVVAAALPGPQAAEPPRTLNVPESFAVAGQVFPPGTVVLRTVSRFSPVANVEEIWVGDRCLGAWVAEQVDIGNRVYPDNAVVFRRGPHGHLVLEGYAVRRDHQTVYYRFRGSDTPAVPMTLAKERATPTTLAAGTVGDPATRPD